MDRSRLVEMAGAFLLGGGVVAVGYELSRPPDPDPDAAVTQAEVASSDPDPADAPGAADGSVPEAAAAPDPDGSADPAPSDAFLTRTENGTYAAYPPVFDPAPPVFDAEAEREFPRHGLVISMAVVLRERPDKEAPIIGILRGGARVRTDVERTFGGRCTQGWQHVFPRGWVCRAAGIKVEDEPPDDGSVTVIAPALDAVLPYEYWRVKDEMTPFFHRLPSFGEQDRADAAGGAWLGAKGREPMPTHPAKRPSEVPAVVKEYMNSGYYVTKAGEEMKSQRRFLRTMRGTYARKYQLKQKQSPTFQGQLIADPKDLPIYFVRRELPLMIREAEGSDVLVKGEEIPTRLGLHPFTRKVSIGPKDYYEDDKGRLMRTYAVGKAYKLKRPPGVAAQEKWVHIDLSEQVLVAYDGDRPVFATLVSTGKEPGMTPIGVHRVQTKHIATSMRDQPPEDEAYSIDDVPWTQYFHGNVALHGAFWHAGFGLERSHGCVNLAPADARWLFGWTAPMLPPGWHAIAANRDDRRGSAVVVTE